MDNLAVLVNFLNWCFGNLTAKLFLLLVTYFEILEFFFNCNTYVIGQVKIFYKV